MDPIIDDLLDLFSDVVGVEPWTGSDGRGKATYGASVDRVARITAGHHKIVRDAAGQERVSSIRVVFGGAFNITAKDRYTLPVRFTPRQPIAISVVHSSDENGAHHERVFFM